MRLVNKSSSLVIRQEVQVLHSHNSLDLLYARPIQSNKTEQKTNRTQSNSNRSIGFGNRTKSNTYFAVRSIFEPIEPI